MSTACPCGQVHLTEPRAVEVVRAYLETGGDPLGDVNLPDGSSYRIPRVYVAYHGLRAAEVASLAAHYGWAQTRAPSPSVPG